MHKTQEILVWWSHVVWMCNGRFMTHRYVCLCHYALNFSAERVELKVYKSKEEVTPGKSADDTLTVTTSHWTVCVNNLTEGCAACWRPESLMTWVKPLDWRRRTRMWPAICLSRSPPAGARVNNSAPRRLQPEITIEEMQAPESKVRQGQVKELPPSGVGENRAENRELLHSSILKAQNSYLWIHKIQISDSTNRLMVGGKQNPCTSIPNNIIYSDPTPGGERTSACERGLGILTSSPRIQHRKVRGEHPSRGGM